MKIVRSLGGLGNQMFQYALYKALKKRFKDVKADLTGYKDYPLHNGFELENIFNIQLPEISVFQSNLYRDKKWLYRKLRRILNLRNVYQEELTLFSFDPSIFNNPKSAYLWGYWQNPDYFKDIAKEIRSDFQFKTPLDDKNQLVLDRIKGSNSVSIHVRRGDYINDPLLGGLCDHTYYQNAIQHIQSQVNSAKYFIFSNDINWCKENLELENGEFISWNQGQSSYIDMQLMSNCKHNIIANSSFSWWGAWLNESPDQIVICPEQWVNDKSLNTQGLLPETWLRF